MKKDFFNNEDYNPTEDDIRFHVKSQNQHDRLLSEKRPNHYITKQDVVDVRILAETSKDINDFISKI